MKHKVGIYVKCPFYSCEEKNRIHCEGVQKRTSLHLVFENRNDLIEYKDLNCKAKWGECMIARMLIQKYE